MGNSTACHSTSSGNGSSGCNSYATSDAQLSTGAIIGIVISSVVALILLIVLVIVLLRVWSRRYPALNPQQPPYFVHPHQPNPMHRSPNPPPYPGTTGI